MNRTTNPKRIKTAAGILAALLLTSIVPLMGAVAANNEPGTPDGLVVVVKPRHGTTTGENAVTVQAENNLFIFDFELYTKTGAPYFVKRLGVDLNSAGQGNDNPDFDGASLIYTRQIDFAEPVSQGTLRIPAAPVMWIESPFQGVVLTLLAILDEDGKTLVDPTTMNAPAGQFSIVANQLAARGQWEEADQADEGFTPLFLLNGQLSSLMQAGNPLLNPGFEFGGPAQKFGDDSVSTPPWVLRNTGGTGPAIRSSQIFAGACGGSGSCASIHVDRADKGLLFGQNFWAFSKNESQWFAGDDLKVQFDIRTNNNYGYRAQVDLWYLDPADGVEKYTVRKLPASSPVMGGWDMQRVVYDFSSPGEMGTSALVPEGAQLTKLFFVLGAHTWPGGGTPIVVLDNVRISGAKFSAAEATLQNDLTDGYSTFIQPQGASTSTGPVVLGQTLLGDGSPAYVFELSAMDYTGNTPMEVPVKDLPFVFQMLDENFVMTEGSHAPADVAFSTSTSYRFVGNEGESDRILVVAPADAIDGAPVKVPWVYFDIPTAPAYADTFGMDAKPASGYYSLVRNMMTGHSIADQMDYAFTPVQLSTSVVAEAAAPELDIVCPYATTGTTCAADPTPTLTVTYAADTRVLETVTVQLVESANTSNVLRTATLDTPADSVQFTLTEAELDALVATGSPRVKAIVSSGAFVAGAVTRDLRLDNVLPTPLFDMVLPEGGAVKGSVVTMTDRSTDDNAIETISWNVTFLSDPTPDGDFDVEGVTAGGDVGPTFAFPVPEDGLYRVVMTIVDSDGEVATLAQEFEATNVAPTASLLAPAFVQGNVPVVLTLLASDVDGFIARADWDLDGDGEFDLNLTETPLAAQTKTFATDGDHTVRVRVWDNDAQSEADAVVITKDFVVDSVAAVNDIIVPNATGLDGWATSFPTVRVTRSDDRSGVLSTRVTVLSPGRNPFIVNEVGSSDVLRNLVGDGIHTVKAVTTDRAGNVGAESVATVKVDTTPPVTSFVRGPSVLGFEPVVASNETKVTVLATDSAAPVTMVRVFVEGVGTPYLATHEGDGRWTVLIDTTGHSGALEINAIATNAAGLANSGAGAPSMTLFVVNPAKMLPPL